jgi:hypothetical protein
MQVMAVSAWRNPEIALFRAPRATTTPNLNFPDVMPAALSQARNGLREIPIVTNVRKTWQLRNFSFAIPGRLM